MSIDTLEELERSVRHQELAKRAEGRLKAVQGSKWGMWCRRVGAATVAVGLIIVGVSYVDLRTDLRQVTERRAAQEDIAKTLKNARVQPPTSDGVYYVVQSDSGVLDYKIGKFYETYETSAEYAEVKRLHYGFQLQDIIKQNQAYATGQTWQKPWIAVGLGSAALGGVVTSAPWLVMLALALARLQARRWPRRWQLSRVAIDNNALSCEADRVVDETCEHVVSGLRARLDRERQAVHAMANAKEHARKIAVASSSFGAAKRRKADAEVTRLDALLEAAEQRCAATAAKLNHSTSALTSYKTMMLEQIRLAMAMKEYREHSEERVRVETEAEPLDLSGLAVNANAIFSCDEQSLEDLIELSVVAEQQAQAAIR